MEEQDENFVSKISEQTMLLHNLAYKLEDMSGSFINIGMKEHGLNLARIAHTIHQSCRDISDAVGAEVAMQVKQSFQSSENLLMAALAGAELAKRDSKKNTNKHVCDNCGKTWKESNLKPIKDYHERVDSDEVPSGECPKCGALCYAK